MKMTRNKRNYGFEQDTLLKDERLSDSTENEDTHRIRDYKIRKDTGILSEAKSHEKSSALHEMISHTKRGWE